MDSIDYPNPYEVDSYSGYNSNLNSSRGSSYSNNDNYNDQDSGEDVPRYEDNYQDQFMNRDYRGSNGSSSHYDRHSDINQDQSSTYSGYSDDSNPYDQRDKDRMNRRNRSERRRDRRRDDHDRGRDRDYDRGLRSRSRERMRDRDFGRDAGDSYDGEMDRRDSSMDRDRSYRRRDRDSRDGRDQGAMFDGRAGEKWMTDTPTNTIILRGLPHMIEEKDIRAELMLFGAPVKDVRLMRRSTGASRGFAFVEFQNVDDAQRWTETNQGRLVLANQHVCSMHYSTPKNPGDKQMIHKLDWTCSKCGVHNFKRREQCFKCNITREESSRAQADGYDQVGTNPCNTLLFRGLDALTTEENLLQALNTALNTTTPLTVKNSQIIRDPVTSTSMGFGFIEMMSVVESMNLLENLKALNPPLEVDGKLIMVSFAKNTFSTTMATIANPPALQAQSWDYSQQQGMGDYYHGYDYSQAGFDASTSQYYSQASSTQFYESQGYDYSSYYGQQVTAGGATASTTTSSTSDKGQAGGKNLQTDSTNAAAAVAQAAIQQAQAAKQYKKQQQKQQKLAEMSSEERLAQQAQEWTKHAPPDGVESANTKYPPPDVTQYQFDETSGYYYDPLTRLYYDANSTYYYNGNTGQFLYWDAEQSTYLPAPTQEEGSKQEDKNKKEGNKDKKEKVKVAKKIAKDMEKWAKTQNAQKEALKDGMKRISLPNLSGRKNDEKESATADAGFAILEKTKSGVGFDDTKLMPPPPPIGDGGTPRSAEASGLVASYGGDSDDDDEDRNQSPGGVIDESKLVDLTKMACLLCKRQFQSRDQLQRHQQMSDLHKQNLEAFQKKNASGSPSDIRNQQYRDRAKERREKYGLPGPPDPQRKPPMPEVPFEQPTKAGLTQDNIGNKMLQKMGWTEGQGLGRQGQGITKPIQAQKRSVSAGLGMRGANYGAVDSDSYKDAGKKAMFARFNESE